MSSSKRLGALAQGIKGAKQKHSTSSKRQSFELEQILERPHEDTRPLNPQHVEELAESIAAVGLIQPIAIDSQGHLLAGGHRRAALHFMALEQPQRFAELFAAGVPVRVFDFNAEDDPERAIAIEAAENEKRRDYTPDEVRELADRLVAAGYHAKAGRSKRGQKSLKPALALIIGKSERTVQRYLNPDIDKPKETSVPFSREIKMLAGLERRGDIASSVSKQATKLRKLLEAAQ